MNERVHVLHRALPLCGFSTELPRRWPEGHRWVSLFEWVGEPSLATCPECADLARDHPDAPRRR